jgi:hypothetical protein
MWWPHALRGISSIENGVTVDLRALKGISLNEDKSIVEIAAGERGRPSTQSWRSMVCFQRHLIHVSVEF